MVSTIPRPLVCPTRRAPELDRDETSTHGDKSAIPTPPPSVTICGRHHHPPHTTAASPPGKRPPPSPFTSAMSKKTIFSARVPLILPSRIHCKDFFRDRVTVRDHERCDDVVTRVITRPSSTEDEHARNVAHALGKFLPAASSTSRRQTTTEEHR